MTDLTDNIIILSWAMLVFGWIVHLLRLMRHIEQKRQKPTSLLWFIRHRPRKFALMTILPVPLGLIEYVLVAPSALDMAVTGDRAVMAGYLAAMLCTGMGSNVVIDRLGIKAAPRIEDDEDEYKTEFMDRNG